MITPPMEPFYAGERVKGMVLGALAGEFSFVPRHLGRQLPHRREMSLVDDTAHARALTCRDSVKNVRGQQLIDSLPRP